MSYTRFQFGINNMCSKPLKHFKITLLLFFQSLHNTFYLDTRNLSIACQSIKRVAVTQQTKHTIVQCPELHHHKHTQDMGRRTSISIFHIKLQHWMCFQEKSGPLPFYTVRLHKCNQPGLDSHPKTL